MSERTWGCDVNGSRRPYPEGSSQGERLAWDEAWRQRLRADRISEDRDRLRSLVVSLSSGLAAVESLINQSEGVTGLHLNGDIAECSDLLAGGRYEGWLVLFCDALECLARWEAERGEVGNGEGQSVVLLEDHQVRDEVDGDSRS